MPLNTPKNRLVIKGLDEVSLVTSGDDPKADILIAKVDPKDALRAAADRINKSSTGTGNSGTLTLTTSQPEEPMGDTSTISKDDLPPEVVEYMEDLEDLVDALLDDEPDGEDDPEGSEDKELATVGKKAPETETISKAEHETVISKLEERIVEAERIAKEERDIRIRGEMIAKAEGLGFIQGTAIEKADILAKLNEVDPELAKQVEAMFTAANVQIEKGGLFNEFGKSTPAEGTAAAEVEAKAQELTKADPKLTHEQAIAKVYEADPALYTRHLQEG